MCSGEVGRERNRTRGLLLRPPEQGPTLSQPLAPVSSGEGLRGGPTEHLQCSLRAPALGETEGRVRMSPVQALGGMSLAWALGETGGHIRSLILALRETEGCVRSLVPALGETEGRVRMSLAGALRETGGHVRSSAPALRETGGCVRSWPGPSGPCCCPGRVRSACPVLHVSPQASAWCSVTAGNGH